MSANDVVGTLTRGLKEIHLDDSELDDRTVIGESELVRRYDEINAKTMYNMMEEIGDQRLFFLTNQQADLLAESEASIDRLIRALELPKEPKLVIILQPDQGFTNLVSCWDNDKNWGVVVEEFGRHRALQRRVHQSADRGWRSDHLERAPRVADGGAQGGGRPPGRRRQGRREGEGCLLG